MTAMSEGWLLKSKYIKNGSWRGGFSSFQSHSHLFLLGNLQIDDFRTTTPLDCVKGLLRMLNWALAGVAPKPTPLLTAICQQPRKSRT